MFLLAQIAPLFGNNDFPFAGKRKNGVRSHDGEGSGYEVSAAQPPPPHRRAQKKIVGIDGGRSFPQSDTAPAHFFKTPPPE